MNRKAKSGKNRQKFVPLLIGRTKINQEQFTQLYNRLLRIAYYRAGRYFRDAVLRQDAADEAMNDAVDKQTKMIEEGCFDEETAKRTIESSLRQSSRKRSLEPISLTEEEKGLIGSDGVHGYVWIRYAQGDIND